MKTRRLPACSFASFAADDLVRWRALRDCVVSPEDTRWGEGRVTDVRWEGRSDRPDDRGVVYLRIVYGDDLRARVNARAFARLHRSVDIESQLADFIERWFAAAGSSDPDEETRDPARVAALAAQDEALRTKQDSARQVRVEQMRRRAVSKP